MRTVRGLFGGAAMGTAIVSLTTEDKVWNVVTALLLLVAFALLVIERRSDG